MTSHIQRVPFASHQFVIGILTCMALGSAVAATEPPESEGAVAGQQAQAAPPRIPGEHKHSHAHRPLPKAPLGQESVHSQPLPPLPRQR